MQLIKITRQDFVWSFIAYGLSIGSNILILPFILYFLPSNEVGLWFTFLSIAMLANLVDFGISPSILRNTSYIWSGASELRKKGISDSIEKGKPNLILLNQVINASKLIYLFISILALTIIASVGTLYIYEITDNSSIKNIGYIWLIFCAGIFLNIAFNFWTPLLKGIGQIKQSQKALVISKSLFVIISVVLLTIDLGLLGIAISYTLSGYTLRFFTKIYFLKYLNEINFKPRINFFGNLEKNLFDKIWFNSWRLGIVSLGAFAILQSNTLVCSYFFGLDFTASYGLAIQIFAVTAVLANTPYQTYLPRFNQVLSFKDFFKAKLIIVRCAQLNWLIFILLSIFIILFLPQIATYLMKSDFLMSSYMLIFMSVYLFLENNHSMFSGFIAAENKIPFMKSAIFSGLGVIFLTLILIYTTDIGIWTLLIVPAFVQLIYNNWKWPFTVIKKYNIKLSNFLK